MPCHSRMQKGEGAFYNLTASSWKLLQIRLKKHDLTNMFLFTPSRQMLKVRSKKMNLTICLPARLLCGSGKVGSENQSTHRSRVVTREWVLKYGGHLETVPCPTYNVQRTMSNVRCPTYDVQHTMSNVRCPPYDVHRTMSNVQCPSWPKHVFSPSAMVFDTRTVTFQTDRTPLHRIAVQF